MSVVRKILITITCVLPFLSIGQDYVSFSVHPHHVDSISKMYALNPNLSDYLSLDSISTSITIFSGNCTNPEIEADSILFSFDKSSNSVKRDTSILIIPDTLTSFKSYLFAYMIYEGAEFFKTPRKRKKNIHVVVETDKYESLIFHNQYIDTKGQVWYNVQIKGTRFWNSETNKSDETPIQVRGWMLKGSTRIVSFDFVNGGCF